MLKNSLFFLVLIVANTSYSMDIETLLKKVSIVYGKKISMDLKYDLFKGFDSKKVHSSYTGDAITNGSLGYQRIDKTEFVYSTDFSLKISNPEKIIVLGNPTTMSFGNIDMNVAKKECSKQKLIEKDTYYEIQFWFKTESLVPCSLIKYKIDKKSSFLVSADFYFSDLQDFSTVYNKREMDYAHLKITFSDITLYPKWDDKIVAFESYFETINSLVKPRGRFTGYELLNQQKN